MPSQAYQGHSNLQCQCSPRLELLFYHSVRQQQITEHPFSASHTHPIFVDCRGQIAGSELPGMDSLEATEKLRTVQKVLAAFRASFLETQARSGGVWKIHPSAPFARLDAFLERCQEVYGLKAATLQFSRLERVEIGGTEVTLLAQPESLDDLEQPSQGLSSRAAQGACLYVKVPICRFRNVK